VASLIYLVMTDHQLTAAACGFAVAEPG